MVSRNLTIPHRLLCITDRPREISKDIPTYQLWDAPSVVNPNWGITRPQCYVRLKAFSEEIREILGDRFVSIDLDCVVTGNLDKTLGRTEDFIINAGETPKNAYNGSMWMMNAGARRQVWEQFGQDGIMRALKNGYMGSDQAWIRECLGPDEATWKAPEVCSFVRVRTVPNWEPTETSIVFFQGSIKPWDAIAQKMLWVRHNYK
jgi:hypothetical protein